MEWLFICGAPNVEQSPEKYEKKSVASVTIDHVLKSSHCDQEKLFFKLDVEGYEYRVLLGMQETIEQTQEILGFVEFDPTLLRRAGENVHEYWDFLRNQFNVYALRKMATGGLINISTCWNLSFCVETNSIPIFF